MYKLLFIIPIIMATIPTHAYANNVKYYTYKYNDCTARFAAHWARQPSSPTRIARAVVNKCDPFLQMTTVGVRDRKAAIKSMNDIRNIYLGSLIVIIAEEKKKY